MDEYGRLLVKSTQTPVFLLDWASVPSSVREGLDSVSDEQLLGSPRREASPPTPSRWPSHSLVDLLRSLAKTSTGSPSADVNDASRSIETNGTQGELLQSQIIWPEATVSVETVPPNGWRLTILRQTDPNARPLSCSVSSVSKIDFIRAEDVLQSHPQQNRQQEPEEIREGSNKEASSTSSKPVGFTIPTLRKNSKELEVLHNISAVAVLETEMGKVTLIDASSQATGTQHFCEMMNAVLDSHRKIQHLYSEGFKQLVKQAAATDDPSCKVDVKILQPHSTESAEEEVPKCSVVLRFASQELLFGVKSPSLPRANGKVKWRLCLDEHPAIVSSSAGGSVVSFVASVAELPPKTSIAKSGPSLVGKTFTPRKLVVSSTKDAGPKGESFVAALYDLASRVFSASGSRPERTDSQNGADDELYYGGDSFFSDDYYDDGEDSPRYPSSPLKRSFVKENLWRRYKVTAKGGLPTPLSTLQECEAVARHQLETVALDALESLCEELMLMFFGGSLSAASSFGVAGFSPVRQKQGPSLLRMKAVAGADWYTFQSEVDQLLGEQHHEHVAWLILLREKRTAEGGGGALLL